MLIIPEDILDGCLRKDRAAQEQLYRLCYEPYMRLCLRYAGNRGDASDILNKAFFKILTRIDQFRAEGNFAAWMKRIVVNAAVDYVRANNRFRNQEPVESASEIPGQSLPDEELIRHDLLQMLRQLPFTTASVFNLFALEGYAHKEIAEMLGITESNSKWHLHYARQLLQQQINRSATI